MVPSVIHIRRWLLLCAALVALMVVVGGLTRLTESGLSIVSWKPVVGIVPPLSAEAWQSEFDAYQQTPQYLKVNTGMTLGAFKSIFWLEYLHRLLGRLVGVVFLFPYLYFLARGALRGELAIQLGAIFMLGAVQGAVGWWMVASGLVNQPMVSPLRLAFHLGMAFLIYGLLLRTYLSSSSGARSANRGSISQSGASEAGVMDSRFGLRPPENDALPNPLLPRLLLALVFLQVLLGALVAGWRAGLTYNTFPLMDGRLIPAGLLQLEPWWRNLIANTATVQWNHRMLATLILLLAIWHWWRTRRRSNPQSPIPNSSRSATWLLAAIAVQYALGVFTLLLQVPLALGSLHQAMAVVVFTCALYAQPAEKPAL